MRSGVRWWGSVVAAFAVVLASGVVAASGDDALSGRSPLPKPSGDLVTQARAQAQATETVDKARLAMLASPTRKAKRLADRRALAGLSRADALTALKAHHAELLQLAPYKGLALKGDESVKGYINDFVAKLDHAGANGDQGAIATSLLPLRTRNAQGDPVTPDLTLGAQGTGFAPAKPLVPVELAGTSGGGVVFSGAGFTVKPVGSDVTATQSGQSVFYANVATDTDWIAQAIPTGAEGSWQLRSADSPETLKLTVTGGTVSSDGAGGAVVRRDGKDVGHIAPPTAWDADKQPVDTSLTVTSGDTITVSVTHHGRDVAYPLIVDPTVTANFFFAYQGDDAVDYWEHHDYTSGKWNQVINHPKWFYWGNGLYTENNANPTTMYMGDQAIWAYRSPGRAHIYRAYMTKIVHGIGAAYYDCLNTGLVNSDFNAWEGPYGTTWNQSCGPAYPNGYSLDAYPNASGSIGNALIFQDTPYQPYAIDQESNSLNDAQIYLTDEDTPTGNIVGENQVNGLIGPDGGVQAQANDPSLGVSSIVFHGPTTWNYNGQTSTASCPYGPCGKNYSPDVPATGLPDGANTITATASDPIGHAGTISGTVNVDATPPRANVGGSDWNSDGLTVTQSTDSLTVDASDPADDAGASSGVRSVRVFADGTQIGQTWTNPACTASTCPTTASASVAIDNTSMGDGGHELQVEVDDGVGNATTQTANVTIGQLTALSTQPALTAASDAVNVANGATSSDAAGASVASVGDVDGDGFDDYAIGAPAARSGAGAVYLVFGDDQTTPMTLGDATQRASGGYRSMTFVGQSGDAAGTDVAAGGDVNGDGVPDIVIGAPGASLGLASGRVYVVFGSPTFGDAGHREIALGTLGTGGFTVSGPQHVVADTTLLGLPKATTFGAQVAPRLLAGAGVSGDINGDGLDDIVIGDASAGSGILGSRLNGGLAYVIFGSASSTPIDLNSTGGSPGLRGFRVQGAASNHLAGQGTALIGDTDGDGRAEFVVTAPGDGSPAGAAYVIRGRSATTDIDLGTLGTAGYRIGGAGSDRLTSAASVGDIDGDGRPDMMLGGRGAVVLYGTANNDPVSLSGSFDGYRILAPANIGTTAQDTARVAGIGDVNGDGSPDQFVEFPTSSSQRRGFVVFGRVQPATVDLDSLGADKGTAVMTGNTSATGSPSAGVDSTPDSQSHTVVADSNGVAAYRSASYRATGSAPTGCVIGSLKKYYYRNKAQSLPPCRKATSNGTADTPLIAYKPSKPHLCIGDTCDGKAAGGGNARIQADLRVKNQTVDLKDSYGQSFAAIKYVRFGCYEIYRTKSDGSYELIGSTNPVIAGDAIADGTCNHNFQAHPEHGATLELQGRACMATSALTNNNYFVRINSWKYGADKNGDGKIDTDTNPQNHRVSVHLYPSLPAYANIRSTAHSDLVQGFASDGDVEALTSAERLTAQAAYPGCMPPQRKTSTASLSDVTASSAFHFSSPADPFADLYQSNRAINRDCVDSQYKRDCGAPLSNYRGPSFAPYEAMIESSTTGVSGTVAGKQGSLGGLSFGGQVRAIVPIADAGRPSSISLRPQALTERFASPDANVPCGDPRVAQWSFGNFNPSAPSGQYPIYGWIGARIATPLPPRLTDDNNRADGTCD